MVSETLKHLFFTECAVIGAEYSGKDDDIVQNTSNTTALDHGIMKKIISVRYSIVK